DALAVARPVGPRAPCRLFVVDEVGCSFGLGTRAPKATRPVDAIGIVNEEQLFAVWRPRRADLVVDLTVVITLLGGDGLLGQALSTLRYSIHHPHLENMEVLVVGRGDIRDARAVGRPARLDVHSTTLGDLDGLLRL